MKFTKNNLVALKQQADDLQNYVIDYVLQRWEDYDIKENIVKEVIEHGCISGIVSSLIYYHDTLEFYEKYKTLINELVTELIQETGIYELHKLFRDFDKEDPLIQKTHNKNLFAWYGFEETMYRLAMLFEIV